MSDALAALAGRVGARTTFVVGKGGVGKTTTAAALALRLADSGRRTHLVSTDPAHSVGDVFDVRLPDGRVHESPCVGRLTLEEFDAAGYARRWAGQAEAAVAELVERGTYLDAEDSRALMELSLPGVDEVMAVLRLVELAGEPIERVVVDTAPTGHMLRMLDAGRLIEGWVAALRAMAEKADVVASSLVGRAVRSPAEDFLDELYGRVERFTRSVLAAAEFVVVTRAEPAVEAETARLRAELARRGLTLAAEVVVGGPAAGAGSIALVGEPGIRRCEALRRLGREVAEPKGTAERSAAPARAWPPPGRPRGAGAWLLSRPGSLFLFAGKGGVGKTTCAAAFALALAESRPVALLSTDPAGSLEDVLGLPVPAEGARTGSLLARQADAAAEFARLRERYRKEVGALFDALGLERAAALDRAVVESLWEMAPPGMDEIAALLQISSATEAGTVLVVDPAPAGHLLRLLELPGIALEWTHSLLRIFLKYGLARSLDELVQGVLQFAKELKELTIRLSDPQRTSAFVVTLDEPVVRMETLRLEAALRRASVAISAVIVNRTEAGTGAGAAGAVAGESRVDGRSGRPPTIIAPRLAPPPSGAPALQAFLARWEFAS
ncbi:MAG TPA: ArsA family ATPase [Longimicrobiales bacterium]|nr:ArsA family ATPase [Longimicrobiales bacterium]